MKSSEVLLAALERMDGGRKWLNRGGNCKDTFCSLNALGDVASKEMGSSEFANDAIEYLGEVVGGARVHDWNDSAPDFSVIEKGFRAAIELAIAEGD